MKKCKAKKRNGQPCGAAAGPSGYCGFHDPQHGKARALGRKRGGQLRATPHAGDLAKLPAEVRSVPDVMTVLDYTLRELLPQENGIARARALIAWALAACRVLEIGEIETRLAQIEAALGLAQKGETDDGQTGNAA